MSKWIDFLIQPRPESRKTDTWNVVTKETKVVLGIVSWYGPWRCYSFQPGANMVFEHQCLKDIASFLDKLMLQRKIEKQNAMQ